MQTLLSFSEAEPHQQLELMCLITTAVLTWEPTQYQGCRKSKKTAFTHHFVLHTEGRLLLSTRAECAYFILKRKMGK